MKEIAAELLNVIDGYRAALRAMPVEKFDFRAAPGKWSRKEMIGHLIDSAQSNIRRFVVSQYETDPLVVYNQDQWVSIAHYGDWDPVILSDLWYLLNRQAVEILSRLSPAGAARTCLTPERRTVQWLAADYILHLRHHMNAVLDLEPVPYP